MAGRGESGGRDNGTQWWTGGSGTGGTAARRREGGGGSGGAGNGGAAAAAGDGGGGTGGPAAAAGAGHVWSPSPAPTMSRRSSTCSTRSRPTSKTALELALELGDSPGQFLLDMADKLPVIKYVIEAINLFSGIRDKITMGIDEYIDRWSGGMVTIMHNLSTTSRWRCADSIEAHRSCSASRMRPAAWPQSDTLVQLSSQLEPGQ